jgi:hypothetical protein
VCPGTFEDEPVQALGARVLYVHGDRGPNFAHVARVSAALTEATEVTSIGGFELAWLRIANQDGRWFVVGKLPSLAMAQLIAPTLKQCARTLASALMVIPPPGSFASR